MIRCSVIIPTRFRPAKLEACLDRLAEQSLPRAELEVLVGFDGPDAASAALCETHELGDALQAITCDRLGIAHVKNELLARASGDIVVLLNDDVEPTRDFLATHLDAHARRAGHPMMVVGHAPWVIPEDANQFDVLIARTSMVFFYDRMVDVAEREPDRDWGFRHAWNLNLSIPRRAVVDAGGFCPAIANCCYEDVELGYRLEQMGLPVRFEPTAVAPHNHRYTPAGYLEREFRLGYSAFGFADASPACARQIFGRDVLAHDEIVYARAFVDHESAREEEMLETFEALAHRPADTWPGDAWISLAYQQHLTLKRLAFRRGFLHALDGGSIEAMFHPRDGLSTVPPLRRSAAVQRSA